MAAGVDTLALASMLSATVPARPLPNGRRRPQEGQILGGTSDLEIGWGT
jgi:hypothetical protein